MTCSDFDRTGLRVADLEVVVAHVDEDLVVHVEQVLPRLLEVLPLVGLERLLDLLVDLVAAQRVARLDAGREGAEEAEVQHVAVLSSNSNRKKSDA